MTLTLAQARRIIGAAPSGQPFGKTSKMPGYSYGLDAFACKRGSILAKDPRSPCHRCYARRNFYATWTPVVKNRRAHQAAILDPRWADAMVLLSEHYLKPAGEVWFRMHDSGDLQSVQHLAAICDWAERCPWLNIWAPTHEPFIVAEYLGSCGSVIPSNLVIRLSADYNDKPPSWSGRVAGMTRAEVQAALAEVPTSTTHSIASTREAPGNPVQVSDSRKDSVECRAHLRGHQCGNCRACWSPLVRNVSYPLSGGDTAVSRAQGATAKRSSALRVLA